MILSKIDVLKNKTELSIYSTPISSDTASSCGSSELLDSCADSAATNRFFGDFEERSQSTAGGNRPSDTCDDVDLTDVQLSPEFAV